jgi:hypothetical protein
MSDNLGLSCDSAGIVYGIPYHDGVISTFHLESQLTTLQIRKGEERYQISLHDVIDYTLTDVWMNCIINTVYQWPLLSAPLQSDDGSFGANHLYGDRASGSDIEILLRRAIAKLPDANLIQIDCSYGGVLSFVCSRITGARLP